MSQAYAAIQGRRIAISIRVPSQVFGLQTEYLPTPEPRIVISGILAEPPDNKTAPRYIDGPCCSQSVGGYACAGGTGGACEPCGADAEGGTETPGPWRCPELRAVAVPGGSLR